MPIVWHVRDDVGVAQIDRPERRNALDAELCAELADRLVEHPDLGAIVVGATGDRAFCAGADLGRRASDTDGGLEHGGGDTFRPAFEAMLDAIIGYPAPVIAAVNGAALGAGMQLAVACDLRVVTPTARFGIPAGKLGVLISAANVQRLVQVIGHAAARDVLLTARMLDCDEAERVGLVQRRSDDPLDAAVALAAEVVALAPLSVRGHKVALQRVAESAALDPATLAELADREATAFRSDDLQEGLAAFAEKRPPRFQGR